MREPDPQGERRQVGLCVDCRHGRAVTGTGGTRYYLCELSLVRPEYPKYPRIPVVICPGFHGRAPDA